MAGADDATERRDDPAAVAAAIRADYEAEVRTLAAEAQRLMADGRSVEETARIVSARRRELRARFKALTPEPWASRLTERSRRRYGDPLGPSVDLLRSRGYSWQQILEAAARPGPADIGPDRQPDDSTGS